MVQGAFGGDDGDRTHDPFHAMEVLSQLSYVPKDPETRRCGPQIVSDPPQKTRILRIHPLSLGALWGIQNGF